MRRDIDELLRATTPEARFDLETLHRRGVRRRRVARVGVAGGLVALVAIGSLAQSPTPRGVTIEPAGPDQGGDGSSATDTADEADVPDDPWSSLGIGDEDVEAMATRLPTPAAGAGGSDLEAVRGTDLGEDPYLRTENVHCTYREGPGTSVDKPEGGRVRDERLGSDMTFDDVVAECLDSDIVRSGEQHAPGPFTFCDARLEPTAQEEMWASSVPDDRERFTVGEGSESGVFLAALAYESDCATAPADANPPVVLHGPASLERFNDRRRLEVAMKAIEWDCIDGHQAVALAVAAADRLGGRWQVDAPTDLAPTTTVPCWGLELQEHWATLSVHPGGYWDRMVPQPVAIPEEDPRVDDDRRERLVELLGSEDPEAITSAIDRVADGARTSLSATELHDLGLAPAPDSVRLARQVSATGCLTAGSAIALASAAAEVLHDLDPDSDWFVGEMSEQQITGDGPPASAADCFELYVWYAEDAEGEGHRPTLVLAPAWTS